jgi:hypothetical protein
MQLAERLGWPVTPLILLGKGPNASFMLLRGLQAISFISHWIISRFLFCDLQSFSTQAQLYLFPQRPLISYKMSASNGNVIGAVHS